MTLCDKTSQENKAILNADLIFGTSHDSPTRMGAWERRLKSRAPAAIQVTCVDVPAFEDLVLELQGLRKDWKTGFIPQDEVVSAALDSDKHRRESTQSPAWGKTYTGEPCWDH